MFAVFNDVSRGVYQRTAVSDQLTRSLRGVRLDTSKIEGTVLLHFCETVNCLIILLNLQRQEL